MAHALDQRVGVFVDVQNMFYAAKHLYGSKLNFGKLLEYIARERHMVRAITYIVQTPENDQSNFLAMLHSNNYEVRSKELKLRPDGSAKGDWDMGLALDALAMSDRLDVVAIVSGDGDFCDLVNFLKARGVRVEVYSFAYSTSEELRQVATEYYQMGPELVMNPSARPNYGYNNPNYENRVEGVAERRAFAPRGGEIRTENRSYDNRIENSAALSEEDAGIAIPSEAEDELFTRNL